MGNDDGTVSRRDTLRLAAVGGQASYVCGVRLRD
jgi:hypothetical protein